MRLHTVRALGLVGLLGLALIQSLHAQPKHLTDLTGRQDLTPAEIATALKPLAVTPSGIRAKGLPAIALEPGQRTRGITPGLAAIAMTVQFAFDSAEILAESKPNLDSLGTALRSPELSTYQIRIEGHTDSIGRPEYNQHLSSRRAESVKQYLVQQGGVTPERLAIVGRGEDENIADNKTSTGRQKNRRVEFVNLGVQ
jgi:outer membrane protein OmpA-like peptidoglycan-associated protein